MLVGKNQQPARHLILGNQRSEHVESYPYLGTTVNSRWGEAKNIRIRMWAFRRILHTSWIDHVTNEAVLRRIIKDREVGITIKRRKLEYLAILWGILNTDYFN